MELLIVVVVFCLIMSTPFVFLVGPTVYAERNRPIPGQKYMLRGVGKVSIVSADRYSVTFFHGGERVIVPLDVWLKQFPTLMTSRDEELFKVAQEVESGNR